MVRFPSEEKAKAFIESLGDGGVVGKLLPHRKRKVEPLGEYDYDDGQCLHNPGTKRGVERTTCPGRDLQHRCRLLD